MVAILRADFGRTVSPRVHGFCTCTGLLSQGITKLRCGVTRVRDGQGLLVIEVGGGLDDGGAVVLVVVRGGIGLGVVARVVAVVSIDVGLGVAATSREALEEYHAFEGEKES